ncbi:hypothetical protein ANRL2_00265 [Anaerolineae bacterium]|nr:hypothetical protein ANRL2_00265 [Anaerolineae bacterium]
MTRAHGFTILLILLSLISAGCHQDRSFVQRPEQIRSLREVVYDQATYVRLASLWKSYYEAYPSEDAYANWMYASRYAEARDYSRLLAEGAKLYPSNPVLIHLRAREISDTTGGLEALALEERAAELDPSFMDPWFSLVLRYMERGDREKLDVALRKLMNSGIIANEVMDYAYNMLIGLDKDAVLVTNGDNDTYPVWILTRIAHVRSDVHVVNISLLNTDWYPGYVQREGLPTFVPHADTLKNIVKSKLDSLRALPKDDPAIYDPPQSTILLSHLAYGCRTAGRPVFFALTLQRTPFVTRLWDAGRIEGTVVRITPPEESPAVAARRIASLWLNEFRTGGLDGWELRYADESRAGRQLLRNYASGMRALIRVLADNSPEFRLPLFRWYCRFLQAVLPAKARDEADRMWCGFNDIQEIDEWCRSRNLAQK